MIVLSVDIKGAWCSSCSRFRTIRLERTNPLSGLVTYNAWSRFARAAVKPFAEKQYPQRATSLFHTLGSILQTKIPLLGDIRFSRQGVTRGLQIRFGMSFWIESPSMPNIMGWLRSGSIANV